MQGTIATIHTRMAIAAATAAFNKTALAKENVVMASPQRYRMRRY
jgi:hypothetical protein